MSIFFEIERLSPKNFDIAAVGRDPGVRPVARESGIDKDWGVLLSLLTNDEHPPPFVTRALTGAPEIVEDDDWFHAVRLRDPAMTKRLAVALAEIDDFDLEERYYRVDLSTAYGRPDHRSADHFANMRHAFHLLKDFYSAASAAGDAVIFQLLG